MLSETKGRDEGRKGRGKGKESSNIIMLVMTMSGDEGEKSALLLWSYSLSRLELPGSEANRGRLKGAAHAC